MRMSQKGFSLIELMVVVAIIGILATIAVPQVNKFMAKARQAEAKATLSGIYTSEKAFFTEYNVFRSEFQTIGYAPEGRVRYNAGLGASLGACPPSLLAGVGCIGETNIVAYCGVAGRGCVVQAEVAAPSPIPAAASSNQNVFTAAAVATLVAGGGIDTWTIDQNKFITQTVNGIP